MVTAVDAALGFIAGRRWVRRQHSMAVLESVRDVARDVTAPEHVQGLIESTLGCDQDPILAAQLTDGLLDIRNAARKSEVAIGGVR